MKTGIAAEAERVCQDEVEFVAVYSKPFKIALILAAALSVAVGIFLLLVPSSEVACVFFALALCLLLITPSILSYRCFVTRTLMLEEYYIIFFKMRRRVLWSDVAYRSLTVGNNSYIRLYGKDLKRLISFDAAIVGYEQIVRLAKRGFISDIDCAHHSK